MSAWLLLISALVLLLLPALFLRRGGARGEFTGLLGALWWINQLYVRGMHDLVVEGDDRLPRSGPAILVSNHTCGIDHLILQAGTRRVLGFMIAQEYYDHRLYSPFCKAIGCIPVKRDGRDQTALRAALRALKDGRVVPIFPEGRINPSSGLEFHEAKQGAAYIALRAGVPVIPAYIRGTPTTNVILKALTTPSHAHATFGEPIDLTDLAIAHDHETERANLVTATDRFMDAIKALRDRSIEGGSAR